jgi:hypothetical protein
MTAGRSDLARVVTMAIAATSPATAETISAVLVLLVSITASRRLLKITYDALVYHTCHVKPPIQPI